MALIPIIKATAVAETCLEVMIKWQSARHMTHFCWSTLSFFLTSGLTDHDIAVFALSPIIKALHLYIIGGLRLQVSNHVPVFLTWECKRERREGGRGGGKETKVRYRFLEQVVLTNAAQTLSKLILCLLFMSHTFTEVMLLHVLSLSSTPPPPTALPPPSLSLCQSQEGPDSCFTLHELHIWQLCVCPGLCPVLTHTLLLHYCITMTLLQ